MQISVNPLEKYDPEGVMVFLEGELTIAHAETLHQELIGILNSYAHIDLWVKNITRIDLSCVQLLYAFYLSAASIDKTLLLHLELDEEVRNILLKAGFSRILDTPLD